MRQVYHDGSLPPASPGTKCTAEEGKTRQSEAQQADINLTIKKYNLQPLDLEPGWSGRIGEFLDVSALPSYQEAMNQLVKAEEAFMELPPDVRAEFDNSYAKMLDAWQNGEQAEVFEQIGWLERKPAPDPAAEAAAAKAARDARVDEIAEGFRKGSKPA